MNTHFCRLAIFGGLSLLLSCARTPVRDAGGASGSASVPGSTVVALKPMVALTRADDDNLKRDFAVFRRAQINAVDYEVTVSIAKGSDEYKTTTVLNVDLALRDQPLSIDLLTKKIESVKVNGAIVEDFVARTGSLEIPAKYLTIEKTTGKTFIEIETTGEFDKKGKGFQHVIDPEDKSEYVYTDFEPYEAHTLFPCFDQPDLRAKFRLTLEAPADWKAIGNSLPENVTRVSNDRALTRFAQTAPIASYLFFVGAGPFREWTDKFETPSTSVPLSIYARKSLAKFVDAPRLFDITKKGLKFYGDYFGKPYAFSKYAHVFVPEFGPGAMENPGAVVVNERYVHRGAVTAENLIDEQGVILHEMAHMWFGDLVTMTWWNDLWLNESFASYASALAVDRAMQNRDAWADFFGEKRWAYWQDQLVTTHPIESIVDDTRTTKGNFDGITYGKGSSALKQLHFLVGEEAFRTGLRSYFEKYAFRNTVLENFTSEIAAAARTDLSKWTHDWLQTAGPNRVQVAWTCAAGKIDTFNLEQSASVSNTVARHRTRVTLFRIPQTGAFEETKSADVTFDQQKNSVAALIGAPCPDFVFPNAGDYDYALYSLDPTSLKAAQKALAGGLQVPLMRIALWSTLGQMVRDTRLAVGEFVDIGVKSMLMEKNPIVLGSVFGRRSPFREAYFDYLNGEQRNAFAPKVEAAAWSRASELEFFDLYLSVAHSPTALGRLKTFLDGQMLPKGVRMDQDRRWTALTSMARENYPGIAGIIDNEEKRDTTTLGQRSAYAARVAIPQLARKKKFWTDLQSPGRIPFISQKLAAHSFNNPDHPEISEAFVQDYFKRLNTLDWASNDTLVDIYLGAMFPHNVCSTQLLGTSEKHLRSATRLTPLAKREWLEANDELSRCIAVRKFAQAGSAL